MMASQETSSNLKMTYSSRKQGILPIGSDPERIARRSKRSAASTPLMTDREMASRMAAISIRDIWNADSIISWPGLLSCKEEDAGDMLATD